jgi:hypothetical protein
MPFPISDSRLQMKHNSLLRINSQQKTS